MLCERMGKVEETSQHWLRREQDAELCRRDEPLDHQLFGWDFNASIAFGSRTTPQEPALFSSHDDVRQRTHHR